MKALVADDDTGTRLALRRVLERLDYTSLEAGDGMTALDILSRTPVDFVILDLGMPILSGLEVLQALRGSREHAQLPVVVISGTHDETTATEIVKLGVADYLTKPLNAERVTNRLTRVIRSLEKSARDEAATAAGSSANDRSVMIVDGDAAFRRAASKLLSSRYSPLEAGSGLAAVTLCASAAPDVILVGSAIGLFGPSLLVRKLRSFPHLGAARIVLLGTEKAEYNAEGEGTFDAVMPRNPLDENFVKRLAEICERAGAAEPEPVEVP